jgi:hypothetical protein
VIHEYRISGLTLKTGDLICTTDGGTKDLTGQFWRLIGTLIPGDVDHIVVYVGPEGRAVEAGAKGRVISFNLSRDRWDALAMKKERGPFVDTLYGVAYPLEGRGLAPDRESQVREHVAAYCLEQAQARKPYNLNFFQSSTEDAFYCSQLAYKAYLKEGIDLNTGRGIGRVPGTKNIILPQEIWDGCPHTQADG